MNRHGAVNAFFAGVSAGVVLCCCAAGRYEVALINVIGVVVNIAFACGAREAA